MIVGPVFITPNTERAIPWILPVTYTYPLDQVSGNTAGYSTRKLASAYSGNCMKVRRSNDNATQDIGFVGTALDTASLLTFVGANNGFVDTWYNQAGGSAGLNLTSSSSGAQPQIVSSGAVITTINGQPTLKFNGSANFLNTGTGGEMDVIMTTTAGTVMCIYQVTSIGTNQSGENSYLNDGMWCETGSVNGVLFRSTPSVVAVNYDGTSYRPQVNTALATSTTSINIWLHGSNVLYNYHNSSSGVVSGTSNTSSAFHHHMLVGSNYDNSKFMTGLMCEMICNNTALSNANRDTLATSVVAPYGISWS